MHLAPAYVQIYASERMCSSKALLNPAEFEQSHENQVAVVALYVDWRRVFINGFWDCNKLREPSATALPYASFSDWRRWLDSRITNRGEIMIFLGRPKRFEVSR